MRRATLCACLAACVAAAAGCGGDEVADPVDPGEIQVNLDEQGDSNVAGVRALLTFVDEDRTRVLVDGAGPGEPSTGGRLTAHLRLGSCADPGDVAYDLGRLKGGQVTRTIGVGLAALLEREYAIDVLGAPGVGVIACGDLPDELPE
jgi:hypothetical protein